MPAIISSFLGTGAETMPVPLGAGMINQYFLRARPEAMFSHLTENSKWTEKSTCNSLKSKCYKIILSSQKEGFAMSETWILQMGICNTLYIRFNLLFSFSQELSEWIWCLVCQSRNSFSCVYTEVTLVIELRYTQLIENLNNSFYRFILTLIWWLKWCRGWEELEREGGWGEDWNM